MRFLTCAAIDVAADVQGVAAGLWVDVEGRILGVGRAVFKILHLHPELIALSVGQEEDVL